jgi:hypothetical protein
MVLVLRRSVKSIRFGSRVTLKVKLGWVCGKAANPTQPCSFVCVALQSGATRLIRTWFGLHLYTLLLLGRLHTLDIPDQTDSFECPDQIS